MSIQSDVEILSIWAMEYYAKSHNLSEIDTVNLFHKHQVFEKIILQHEYLHHNKINNQVSFHTPLALKHLSFEICKEVKS